MKWIFYKIISNNANIASIICTLLITASVFEINLYDVFGVDVSNKTNDYTAKQLVVIWSQKTNNNTTISFSSSIDNGKTFSAPKNISNNSGIFGYPFKPALSTDNDKIYIVWEGPQSKENENPEIFFSNSTDGGKTFSAPKNISNNTGTSGDPVIGTAGNNIYIMWRDDIVDQNSNPIFFNNGIFFSNSTDGGKTFSAPKNISGDNNINSQNPSIAASGNNIYASWNEATDWLIRPPIFIGPTNYEIFFSNSTDGGKTFSTTPKNITNNLLLSRNPSIAASGNNIYASWMDDNFTETGDVEREIFFSNSTDGGKTFSAPVMVSNNIETNSEFPSVAASGNNIYVVWHDYMTGKSEIFFSNSTDGGKTFSAPKNISNNEETSSFPTIDIS